MDADRKLHPSPQSPHDGVTVRTTIAMHIMAGFAAAQGDTQLGMMTPREVAAFACDWTEALIDELMLRETHREPLITQHPRKPHTLVTPPDD